MDYSSDVYQSVLADMRRTNENSANAIRQTSPLLNAHQKLWEHTRRRPARRHAWVWRAVLLLMVLMIVIVLVASRN